MSYSVYLIIIVLHLALCNYSSNNQLDLQRALSDICAFIAEGPDRHIHPAPLSSLSQLSASTPSYADDQNAGVATHPITKLVFLIRIILHRN